MSDRGVLPKKAPFSQAFFILHHTERSDGFTVCTAAQVNTFPDSLAVPPLPSICPSAASLSKPLHPSSSRAAGQLFLLTPPLYLTRTSVCQIPSYASPCFLLVSNRLLSFMTSLVCPPFIPLCASLSLCSRSCCTQILLIVAPFPGTRYELYSPAASSLW